jgi:acyl-CoA reductase-like NAD-dependent aldehyde dehydrogenase
MASGAGTLKRLTLELGGNDAAIVLDDADPADLAPRLFKGAMSNCGQICVAIKRLYVPETMYEELCTRLAGLARESVVGNGLDPSTEIGPLQNRAQFERVQGFVEDGRRRGTVMTGGELPQGGGYFITPAIVRDIPDDARLVREEQFGPVLPVLRYSRVEEAIRRANDTDYGLGGSVWSPNLERAREVALQLDTGAVCINRSSELLLDVPMGGAKQSGLGYEFGERGLEEFTQGKLINVGR